MELSLASKQLSSVLFPVQAEREAKCRHRRGPHKESRRSTDAHATSAEGAAVSWICHTTSEVNEDLIPFVNVYLLRSSTIKIVRNLDLIVQNEDKSVIPSK